MSYFKKFPLYITNTGENTSIVMTDFFRRTQFGSRFNDVSVALIPYLVLDGETPESVSNKFYGSPYFHWVVLQVNAIVNRYDEWPLPNKSITDLAKDYYGENKLNDIHHYIDVQTGYEVDYDDESAFQYPVTNLEHEIALNDNKRNIRILDAKFLNQVVREFDSLIGR